MADDRHGASGQVGLAFDDAAIMQVAVEHGLLARIEMPAHRGMNAVGANQNVACRFAGDVPGGITELRDDLVVALNEAA